MMKYRVSPCLFLYLPVTDGRTTNKKNNKDKNTGRRNKEMT